ncbi:M42 family peptidase [Mobilitalea sibirica]|uniref:M42 family peptidase n=1 Tax=Mobilitalea sibirica TaxID=1462919 RepID=A0A8J7HA17_9FIRM|nr:M42 family peptidase [Mobilitalea sibirica]MBH1939506.1 M42 family peptidase [Mobilitalea sibirica]
MNKLNTIKMITELSNAKGISGFEDDVVALIRNYCEGFGTIKEDTLRNLYLYYKNNIGNRPIVQLDAHSDEVGFMVQGIKPNGTLQIIPIGGWVTNNIPAHKVWVKNAEGEYIPGIVASKPPHFMSEQEKKSALDIKQITVDVGATSKEEAIKEYKIRIGEPIVPCVDFEYQDKHDLMIGKAFDNRLGCGMVISTLHALEGENLEVDIVGAFASQEEVGTRGSIVTSRTIQPDIAIVFEGCPADDTCVNEYEIQTAIKKGPMLRHIDSRMITNPRYQRFALDLAEKHGIPVQEAVRAGGSTNGASIHLSNQGVPTIVIGVPVRYAHTHYGISSYHDYDCGVKLACEIVRSLNKEVIERF